MGMLQKKENKGLTYYEVMHGSRKTGRVEEISVLAELHVRGVFVAD